jgi:hypothetical protein
VRCEPDWAANQSEARGACKNLMSQLANRSKMAPKAIASSDSIFASWDMTLLHAPLLWLRFDSWNRPLFLQERIHPALHPYSAWRVSPSGVPLFLSVLANYWIPPGIEACIRMGSLVGSKQRLVVASLVGSKQRLVVATNSPIPFLAPVSRNDGSSPQVFILGNALESSC